MLGTAREAPINAFLTAAVAAFCVFVIVMRIRRRLARRRETLDSPQPALDLADLHAMLEAGTITLAEFEQLKTVITCPLATRHGASATPDRVRGFEVLPPVEDLG